jgi:hypothetical protein
MHWLCQHPAHTVSMVYHKQGEDKTVIEQKQEVIYKPMTSQKTLARTSNQS